jgi:hypothetical protein
MAKEKRTPGAGQKARRRELEKQVKHPYITGQGLDRSRQQAQDRNRGSEPPSAEP